MRYAVQYRCGGTWHFWNFEGRTSLASAPREWSMADALLRISELKRTSGDFEFRLIGMQPVPEGDAAA